jgi:hypothetical protein
MEHICLILFLIIVIVSISFYKEQRKQSLLREGLTNKPDSTIILIGDSILNNSNYILSEGKSVPDLIKAEHSNTYNFAKDEAVITDCNLQIEQIPPKNNTKDTYIFVSAGGNNILNIQHSITNELIETFFQQYSTLIHSLKSKFPNANIYLLNLYYPLDSRFKNLYPYIDQWNSLLLDFSKTNKLKIIQTNKLMINKDDFTNAIEPSIIGGPKIAKAILDAY